MGGDVRLVVLKFRIWVSEIAIQSSNFSFPNIRNLRFQFRAACFNCMFHCDQSSLA